MGAEGATSDQSLLLLRMIRETAGHNTSHRFVTVANQDLFAVLYKLDVSAQPRLEIADIHGSHNLIVAKMTMLVILYLLFPFLMARPSRSPIVFGCEVASVPCWTKCPRWRAYFDRVRR